MAAKMQIQLCDATTVCSALTRTTTAILAAIKYGNINSVYKGHCAPGPSSATIHLGPISPSLSIVNGSGDCKPIELVNLGPWVSSIIAGNGSQPFHIHNYLFSSFQG